MKYTIKEHGRPAWMNLIGQELLVCSTVLHPDSHQQQELHRLMPLVKDRDLLVKMAIKEGLASLLYKNLLKSGALKTLGHRQREELRSLYYETVLFNLKLVHDLKEVLCRLNQKKIQAVLMQGIILLQQVYDDLGLRPLTDIDLWVLQKDYPGLISILSSQGYQRDPLYPNTFRKGSTTFDIHTHILWADRIRAHKLLLAKGQEHIYHDTRIIHFEGQEVRCLSRYDQVLYLSLHALKHHVDRLIWLVDIQGLLANWKMSDWEALMDRSGELGQERTISYIFFLLLHLFDFHPPREVRPFLELKRPDFLEKRVLRERVKGYSLPVWAPLLLFSSGKGLQKRFCLILETLFPRPQILRQIFVDSPDLKVWQLYCMRVLQLFGMIKLSLKGRAVKA